MAIKIKGEDVITNTKYGYLERVYVGAGQDNGFFYSDTDGRTAFRDGDFYIQNTVDTYYNYATNQYYGASDGDYMKFRGNTLSGTDWSLTGGGALIVTTVNTGQGDNELYDMDQNVKTSSNVTFHQVSGPGQHFMLEDHSNAQGKLWLTGATPSIELAGEDSTPFIDFRTGMSGSSGDYDMRIINTDNNTLKVTGGVLEVDNLRVIGTSGGTCNEANWGNLKRCTDSGTKSLCVCTYDNVSSAPKSWQWEIISSYT